MPSGGGRLRDTEHSGMEVRREAGFPGLSARGGVSPAPMRHTEANEFSGNSSQFSFGNADSVSYCYTNNRTPDSGCGSRWGAECRGEQPALSRRIETLTPLQSEEYFDAKFKESLLILFLTLKAFVLCLSSRGVSVSPAA